MLILIILITISIGVVSYIGDTLLYTIQEPVLKAIVDNTTHGLIGLLSWIIVWLRIPRPVILTFVPAELFLSYFLSSAVDIDHFIFASSITLESASNYGDKRPPFHCSTLCIIAVLFVLFLAKIYNSAIAVRFGWMIFLSVGSHHLRDAIRRGLWFCPFGSTKPIPYSIYMIILMGLPFCTIALIKVTGEYLISDAVSYSGRILPEATIV